MPGLVVAPVQCMCVGSGASSLSSFSLCFYCEHALCATLVVLIGHCDAGTVRDLTTLLPVSIYATAQYCNVWDARYLVLSVRATVLCSVLLLMLVFVLCFNASADCVR